MQIVIDKTGTTPTMEKLLKEWLEVVNKERETKNDRK